MIVALDSVSVEKEWQAISVTDVLVVQLETYLIVHLVASALTTGIEF